MVVVMEDQVMVMVMQDCNGGPGKQVMVGSLMVTMIMKMIIAIVVVASLITKILMMDIPILISINSIQLSVYNLIIQWAAYDDLINQGI